MSVVTPEIVKNVALLARLMLDGDALSVLAGQIDEILTYVQTLQAVPTEGVEPTSHVLPLRNVLREDVVQPCLPAGAAVGLAPASQPPFITVPKVLENG